MQRIGTRSLRFVLSEALLRWTSGRRIFELREYLNIRKKQRNTRAEIRLIYVANCALLIYFRLWL